MRKNRPLLTLALAAVAAAALAVPGAATASEWTKNGQPLSGPSLDFGYTEEGYGLSKSASTTLEGTIMIAGTYGTEKCTLSAKATLSPGATGQITEATIPIASCSTSGSMAACKITSATPNSLPWTLAPGSNAIGTGFSITFKMEGGPFCIFTEDRVSGGYLATPDNARSMKSLTLSSPEPLASELITTGGKTWLSKRGLSGSLGVSPANKYGVGVPIEIGGGLNWTSGFGGISCSSLKGATILNPGSEGVVDTFSWGPCTTSGGLSGCTVNSVTPQNLPWTIQDEGTKVKVSNFGFQMSLSGAFCGYASISGEGTMIATPDNAAAISKLSLSGTLAMEVGGGSTSGTWSGSGWSVTPAGVYGL